MLLLSSKDQRVAMGVTCRIEVVAPNAPQLIDAAFSTLHSLESLWSRFLPTSDISRLNHAQGSPISVDPRTLSLIATMKAAMTETGGAFNPTRLPDQITSGDADSLVSPLSTVLPNNTTAFPHMDNVDIHPEGTVRLPQHMTLDAGGLGKGFAADLIAQELLARGAVSACVNLGGDMRALSTKDTLPDWGVDILSPFDPSRILSTISLRNGAVATSARTARWRDGRGVINHIQGARTDIIAASAIASTGAWAEVWAKHLIVSNDGLRDLDDRGLAGLIVFADGHAEQSPRWKDFVQC